MGGTFEYVGAERENMDFNLKMVDSEMPQIVGEILLCFYKERIAPLTAIVNQLSEGKDEDYKLLLTSKIKKLLLDALLGFLQVQNGMALMNLMVQL